MKVVGDTGDKQQTEVMCIGYNTLVLLSSGKQTIKDLLERGIFSDCH